MVKQISGNDFPGQRTILKVINDGLGNLRSTLSPRGEARIKEGANEWKDKTGKRWEFSFLLARKVLAFLRPVSRRWSTPEHSRTCFLSPYTLVQCSRYYLTIAITSFLSLAIIRSFYCYCAPKATWVRNK